MTDSALVSKDGKTVSDYLDRSEIFAVQTPQTFLFSLIYKAHHKFRNVPVTDDASLVQKLGKEIAIVIGSKDNVKITVPDDVAAYLAWKNKRK